MQSNFNVITLNVRGLRNPVKRRSILCFLKDQNCQASLWLGPWRHCKETPFGFQWPEKPVRILGSYVSYDVKQNEKLNFETICRKCKVSLMSGIVEI